jgi:hypothetical protein
MKSVFLSRLLALVLVLAAASARALPVTIYWDGPVIGAGTLGVSQATATNAGAAGVPILQPAIGSENLSESESPTINRSHDPGSLVLGSPTTLTANWNVVNDTAASLQNLYLVFMRPESTVVDGHSFDYEPAEVGLTLGAGWVLFQVDAGANTVYYPAVSLGNLGNGANAGFPLFYSLKDRPEFFSENFNFELGMPTWRVFFVTAPIPEPASGLLVLTGLLGIAVGRRKRS